MSSPVVFNQALRINGEITFHPISQLKLCIQGDAVENVLPKIQQIFDSSRIFSNKRGRNLHKSNSITEQPGEPSAKLQSSGELRFKQPCRTVSGCRMPAPFDSHTGIPVGIHNYLGGTYPFRMIYEIRIRSEDKQRAMDRFKLHLAGAIKSAVENTVKDGS